ncbi:MAG: CDP-alcohol phosphatidyltransferase family protein [Oscillospiraceae bacterium]|nr:CDP-alcohol phosphatidyltransferase family protein [Oscillospiraceae bacterium]
MKALPNILSVFRICLVPAFIVAYILDTGEMKVSAIIIYAIACFSDFLDGYLARRLRAQSKLGKLLDPLGDKLITFAVLICITISRPMLLWAVCVFFIKEILMGIGGLVIHKKAKTELPPANILGKISTVLFFLVCASLLIFVNLPDVIVMIMISGAIGFTLIALLGYVLTYAKIMRAAPPASPRDAAPDSENPQDTGL